MIVDERFDHLYLKGMDVDLHLLTKGDTNGIPLIFIPGITSYCQSFVDILNRLPDRYYSLVLDVRGRGESSWPEKGYRDKNYVEDLLIVVNALIHNPTPPVLIGHSMGARIAAAFDSMYPGLISGLTLVDPPINGPGHREEYPNSLEMFLEQKEAIDAGKLEKFKSFFPNFSESQIKLRAQEYRNCSKNAIIESYYSFLREPLHVHLKRLTAPTLLLAAEHGDTIRDDELELINSLNTKIKSERVKDSGHMVYKEKPQEFTDSVLQFVESLQQSTSFSRVD